jgi:hypothetical protein
LGQRAEQRVGERGVSLARRRVGAVAVVEVRV